MGSTSIKRATRLIRPEGTRRSAVAAAVLALAAVAGCSSESPPAPTPPISSQLRAALKQWSAFPASAAARPLVVEAGAAATGPPGFPDGADQDAYSDGAISLFRPLPTGPATAAGFPLITASDAASVLTSGHGANPSPATRLTVTARPERAGPDADRRRREGRHRTVRGQLFGPAAKLRRLRCGLRGGIRPRQRHRLLRGRVPGHGAGDAGRAAREPGAGRRADVRADPGHPVTGQLVVRAAGPAERG